MHKLQLDKATRKTVKGHQYYVFPKPATHKNPEGRPTAYPDKKVLKVYTGKGSNGSALLHPDVMGPADQLMTALIEYGEHIDDWSMRNAVIQSGWRPDDASQGRAYLRILKQIMARDKAFEGVTFPAGLEEEAQSELIVNGNRSRLWAFMKRVAESPGWTQALADNLFNQLHRAYVPRGFNPHATGFAFDIDFPILLPNGTETWLGASTAPQRRRLAERRRHVAEPILKGLLLRFVRHQRRDLASRISKMRTSQHPRIKNPRYSLTGGCRNSRMKRKAKKTSDVERELVEGLGELLDVLKSGEAVPTHFTCRKVTLDLEPQRLSPRQVRSTRNLLHLSQGLFARFLGAGSKVNHRATWPAASWKRFDATRTTGCGASRNRCTAKKVVG